MKLFDSHAHLTKATYGDAVGAVIERAAAAGVETITTIGSLGSLEACQEAVDLAGAYTNLWATVGIHPHHAERCDEQAFQVIEAHCAHAKVRAVGETGLDFHYMKSPKATQIEVFARFIDLAKRVRLPIIVHNRESDGACLEVLRSEAAHEVGGVIHCFSTSWSMASQCLDIGFMISFSGMLTFKGAQELREVAQKVPLERLMLETDCPYLAPTPHRGKTNEPALMVQTALQLAQVRGMAPDALAEVLTANTKRFYGIE
ncbi:MAG: hypothetical protein AUK47_05745 [Deltaproteobacteria bacterium CG2_30_63_29]|nr:MAG: hypothetical protein AUK47_05745 [Deltaproteobacteria bacterium CG2_30_63_29]PJB42171.1 MAG: hydrolase TatD [Deltaproteobacteria bacterium CG_4_9_14_3_um_filter_63_12]